MEKLRKMGAKAVKYHPAAGSVGEPDIIGCYRGVCFAFELKVEGGKTTKMQIHRLKQWYEAGAKTAIIESLCDVVVHLEGSGQIQKALGYIYGEKYDKGLHCSRF